MNSALVSLAYTGLLAFGGPKMLTWLAPERIGPRANVTAWLTVVAAAIATWLVAIALLAYNVIRNISHHAALALCLNGLGEMGRIGLPDPVTSVIVLLGCSVLMAFAALTVGRVFIALRRVRRRNREHAAAVHVIGRRSRDADGVVVVVSDQPTVYCVGGSSKTIVVTTAALDALDEAALAAVLAHEKAHLRGQHHLVLTLLNALSGALPWIPLFGSAAGKVAASLEMCADDAAVREHGPRALLDALVNLTHTRSAPVTALAAAGTAVLDRAARLLTPQEARPCRAAGLKFAVTACFSVALPLSVLIVTRCAQ